MPPGRPSRSGLAAGTRRSSNGRRCSLIGQSGTAPVSSWFRASGRSRRPTRRGWTIRALLHDGRPAPSTWAAELWETTPAAARFLVAPELMAELGEKLEGAPELLAVAQLPPDDLSRLGPGNQTLLVPVFDRPSSPGNIGTLIRSADAFGGTGLIVTGHGADPYDPRCVRASAGRFQRSGRAGALAPRGNRLGGCVALSRVAGHRHWH